MVNCVLSFQLDSIPSRELYKDVLVKLVHGKELTLNYFELKNRDIRIPFHEHPAEHLVVVLEGEIEFIFEKQNIILRKKDCLFIPAKTRHTAAVIRGPVKALEIYIIAEIKQYKG